MFKFRSSGASVLGPLIFIANMRLCQKIGSKLQVILGADIESPPTNVHCRGPYDRVNKNLHNLSKPMIQGRFTSVNGVNICIKLGYCHIK